MSTRGTYQFENLTFYIHHDNYLEGAARYFYRMIEASFKVNKSPDGLHPIDTHNTRGGMEFAFIRGNGNAEFTKSSEEHGDTQFRYIIHMGDNGLIHLNAQEKHWTDGDLVHWRVIYNDEISEFINQYAETDAEKIIYGMDVDYSNKCTYATLSQAHEVAMAFYSRALLFDVKNPNRASYVRHGCNWKQAIKEILPDTD